MTVKELIEELSKYPHDMEVCSYNQPLRVDDITEDVLPNNTLYLNIGYDSI